MSAYIDRFISFNDPTAADYQPLQLHIPRGPIRNAVFEGGGVKGVAYAGAIKALEDTLAEDGQSVLDGLYTVSGTSAGAITAMLVAIGYRADEVSEFVNGRELQRINDPIPLMKILKAVFSKNQLSKNFATNKGKMLEDFIGQRILEKTGNAHLTFRELHEMGGKDLIVTGTNLTTNELEYYSFAHTPDMEIREAVRISAGFPIHFQAKLNEKGEKRVDGALKNNYPINAVDTDEIKHHPTIRVRDPHSPETGSNNQCIGFLLGEKASKQKKLAIFDQFGQIFSTIASTSTQQLANRVYAEQTVTIPTIVGKRHVEVLDFDIPDDVQIGLARSGYIHTQKHLRERRNFIKIQEFSSLSEKYDYLFSGLYGGRKSPLKLDMASALNMRHKLFEQCQNDPNNEVLQQEYAAMNGVLASIFADMHLTLPDANSQPSTHRLLEQAQTLKQSESSANIRKTAEKIEQLLESSHIKHNYTPLAREIKAMDALIDECQEEWRKQRLPIRFQPLESHLWQAKDISLKERIARQPMYAGLFMMHGCISLINALATAAIYCQEGIYQTQEQKSQKSLLDERRELQSIILETNEMLQSTQTKYLQSQLDALQLISEKSEHEKLDNESKATLKRLEVPITFSSSKRTNKQVKQRINHIKRKLQRQKQFHLKDNLQSATQRLDSLKDKLKQREENSQSRLERQLLARANRLHDNQPSIASKIRETLPETEALLQKLENAPKHQKASHKLCKKLAKAHPDIFRNWTGEKTPAAMIEHVKTYMQLLGASSSHEQPPKPKA